MPTRPRAPVLPLLVTLAAVSGCVEQTMTITSDPPGALVYMNDRELGRTPLTRDFTWYGTYDVQVRKDGYQTLNARSPVVAPWWNWVPFDLVANLLPLHLADRQKLHYVLAAEPKTVDEQLLLDRAKDLEGELGAGKR